MRAAAATQITDETATRSESANQALVDNAALVVLAVRVDDALDAVTSLRVRLDLFPQREPLQLDTTAL